MKVTLDKSICERHVCKYNGGYFEYYYFIIFFNIFGLQHKSHSSIWGIIVIVIITESVYRFYLVE